MELVRAAALGGFLDVARDLGADPLALLRRVGLSRSMLMDTEAMLPATAVVDMLELAAAETGCVTIGLRMAERRSLADLGRVSLLLAHQPSLRDAFNILVQYRNRINSTLILHIEAADDIAILREEFSLASPRPARQATELALGVIAGICRAVLPPGWQPQQVCFGYDAPPASEISVYTRVFECPAEFGSELNGLVVKSTDLDLRNPQSDPALALHALRLIETVMTLGEKTLVEEVEETVAILLPSGRASISACAQTLGMHQRTLQRHLDEAGTSFTIILNRAKTMLVQRYFANRRLRLTDVAEMLGYSSLGSFTRWYIQSFGETPSIARKRMRKEVAQKRQN
jgi:AraC-like DNA-binding protein